MASTIYVYFASVMLLHVIESQAKTMHNGYRQGLHKLNKITEILDCRHCLGVMSRRLSNPSIPKPHPMLGKGDAKSSEYRYLNNTMAHNESTYLLFMTRHADNILTPIIDCRPGGTKGIPRVRADSDEGAADR